MYGGLIWAIKLEIISYLDLKEIYQLGCSDKTNFLIFLRERVARNSSQVSTHKRFLGSGWKRESVCLASYPRCGNSFLRKLLENWSGTITGSDSHPYRTLSKSLLQCGFKVPHRLATFHHLLISSRARESLIAPSGSSRLTTPSAMATRSIQLIVRCC
jgi:hypothetical protein